MGLQITLEIVTVMLLEVTWVLFTLERTKTVGEIVWLRNRST